MPVLAMQLPEGSFSSSRPVCPRDPGHRIRRHGCYERYADCDSERRVPVARFLCVFCGWTSSVLPAERLPYIAPEVQKVQADFDARASGTDPPPQSEKERGCLRRAFNRFANRVAPLCAVLGQMIQPIKPGACELWKELRRYSNLQGILLLLCTKFKISLLGDYRSAKEAGRALESVGKWMEEAGLELNGEKTRVVDMAQAGAHFDYLGYRFWRGRGGKLRRFVRPQSRQKLRERLRPLTKRTNGQSLGAIVERLNPILRKRRGGRGRSRGRDHHRWGNSYFAELGLFSLEAARAEEIASLRNGATC